MSAILMVAAVGFIPDNSAEAARQKCNQDDTLIAACVNANVEKNNICVGILQETVPCQTN